MDSLGWVLLALLVALFAPNYYVSRRHLAAYAAAHGRLPSWRWISTEDVDPDVERWRRWRVVTFAGLVVVLVLYAATLLLGR
jgi:hypothetical protein